MTPEPRTCRYGDHPVATLSGNPILGGATVCEACAQVVATTRKAGRATSEPCTAKRTGQARRRTGCLAAVTAYLQAADSPRTSLQIAEATGYPALSVRNTFRSLRRRWQLEAVPVTRSTCRECCVAYRLVDAPAHLLTAATRADATSTRPD